MQHRKHMLKRYVATHSLGSEFVSKQLKEGVRGVITSVIGHSCGHFDSLPFVGRQEKTEQRDTSAAVHTF